MAAATLIEIPPNGKCEDEADSELLIPKKNRLPPAQKRRACSYATCRALLITTSVVLLLVAAISVVALICINARHTVQVVARTSVKPKSFAQQVQLLAYDRPENANRLRNEIYGYCIVLHHPGARDQEQRFTVPYLKTEQCSKTLAKNEEFLTFITDAANITIQTMDGRCIMPIDPVCFTCVNITLSGFFQFFSKVHFSTVSERAYAGCHIMNGTASPKQTAT